jgi:hypothetical protein
LSFLIRFFNYLSFPLRDTSGCPETVPMGKLLIIFFAQVVFHKIEVYRADGALGNIMRKFLQLTYYLIILSACTVDNHTIYTNVISV